MNAARSGLSPDLPTLLLDLTAVPGVLINPVSFNHNPAAAARLNP